MRLGSGIGRGGRAALLAAVSVAALLAPAPAEAASLTLSLSPRIGTVGRPITLTVQGLADRDARVRIRMLPAPGECGLTGRAELGDRPVAAGAFTLRIGFTRQQPSESIICAYLYTPVEGQPPEPDAFASIHLSIRPLAPRLDVLTDLAPRTGSQLDAVQTGFAHPPFTHLVVRVRPGQTACGTPEQEERAAGTALLLAQPVSEEFSALFRWRPLREGPYRICAFLVEAGTNRVGTAATSVVAVTDGLAPGVTAVRSFGTAGRPSRVYFKVFDGSPTSATVTVSRGGELLASVSVPASRALGLRSAVWAPSARLTGTLRFCVQARDSAGNSGSACGAVVVRARWVCGEPTPARRAGRCDRPWAMARGADARGFVRCGAQAGVSLTARWTSCANARTLYGRWVRGAGARGWSCSKQLRQCVAPWPRESYVVWR